MNKKHYYDKESDSLFIYVKEGEEDSFEEVLKRKVDLVEYSIIKERIKSQILNDEVAI